jgi:hypothetical protein
MWLNLMASAAHFGMYLFSGGPVHFVKMLKKDGVYDRFCEQFPTVRSVKDPARYLKDTFLEGSSSIPFSSAMLELLLTLQMIDSGASYAEKLATAWACYVQRRLHEEGFRKKWVRVYAEIPEFYFIVGSLSLVHFGPRFPLLFGGDQPEHEDWSVRIHRYITDDTYRVCEEVERETGQRYDCENVELHTVDIRDHDYLNAALCLHPDCPSVFESFRPFQD